MELTTLLLLLLASLAVTAVARRLKFPAPLLVVAVALAASAVPGLPDFRFDSEVILTIVLPPLLYSAALDISYQDFHQSLRQITKLGIGLVAVTAVVAGLIAFWIVPELTLPAALLLGAIVAPPDAVSAAAIGKKLGLPRRVMTVLSGESLINDAAALTLFKVFLAGVALPTRAGEGIATFVIAVVVGIPVGLALGYIVHLVRARLNDAVIETVLSLLLPFVAYTAADQLGGSGVLAAVAAGLFVGYHSPRSGYATRLQEQPIWAATDVLLEAFVFALIGLQLPGVVEEAADSSEGLWPSAVVALVLLAVCLLVRPAFVFGTELIGRRLPSRRRQDRLTWQETTVVSWTGMRGVVTLAASASVPQTTATGEAFPGHSTIVITAFTVTVGSLLLQGLTLPWLIRRMGVADPGRRRRQLAAELVVFERTTDRALAHLHDHRDQWDARYGRQKTDQFIGRLEQLARDRTGQVRSAVDAEEESATASATAAAAFEGLRRDLLRIRRDVLMDERDAGTIDDEVMRQVLLEIDAEELAMDHSWLARMRS
ncbi:Na+/H+ antiporter [Tersicoccus phoenicis]|uniref:Na+/H+ antiporter n=1 Tax=Tersicoccus phoenicis TaxID=554083 RepID=A0A1R1L7S1_9MICC|nr:Na+/H+ antiporter [Tersicoccus phoenicis]OMH23582.1 Na+/H+ antiporter [Tersicoccus phoenicis]